MGNAEKRGWTDGSVDGSAEAISMQPKAMKMSWKSASIPKGSVSGCAGFLVRVVFKKSDLKIGELKDGISREPIKLP